MTRSASSSLRGYSYQFHESIIRLLDSANDDAVTFEGIEDIDLHSECVQVKYLSSQKLIPSSVKTPATLMLEDYVHNHSQRQDTTYTIYAYFGDSTGDAGFLEKDDFYNDCANALIMDEKKDITEISENIREEFKGKFKLDIGKSFEDQENSAQQKLMDTLDVSAEETAMYFYPNAMNLVLSLSIQNDRNSRTISKKDFLSSINQKKHLFGIWQRLEIGKEAFLSKIKDALSSGDFRDNKERLIFIDTTCLSRDATGYGDSQLIIDLIEKHSLINKNTETKPLTVVINAPDNEIKSLKSLLIDRGKEFNDGYEQINFSAEFFNKLPIKNTSKPLHRKISKTSYEIRLIHSATYLKNREDINKPDTTVCFSQEIPFDVEGAVQYHIPTIETYRDIKNILS